MEIGKDFFFPGGTSKKVELSDVSCDILDFQENLMDANITIGEIYATVKMGIVRFYLSTKLIELEEKQSSSPIAVPDVNASIESNTIEFGPFSSEEDEVLDDTIPIELITFPIFSNVPQDLVSSQEVQDSISLFTSENKDEARSPTPPLERLGSKVCVKIHRVNAMNDMIIALKKKPYLIQQ